MPIGPKRAPRLGISSSRRGQPAEAEAEYKAALRLSPQYVPAAINLADLYRQLGRDSRRRERAADGDRRRHRAMPGCTHALGLTLTRLKRLDEALAELRRAAELEPDRARYAYVYAVALHSAGRAADAIALLKENLARHPSDRDTLMALVSFHRGVGDIDLALEYAEQLALIIPEDKDLAKLVQDLRQQGNKPVAR